MSTTSSAGLTARPPDGPASLQITRYHLYEDSYAVAKAYFDD